MNSDGNFNRDGFQIVEEWSYQDSITSGLSVSNQLADEALSAIMYALQSNPSAFGLAFGQNIRVAKMNERPLDGLPVFRVFFRVDEASRTVDLLHVDHG